MVAPGGDLAVLSPARGIGLSDLRHHSIPKVLPLRIDREATWNPHYVPVLPKGWAKERVASAEIDANGSKGSPAPR